MKPDHHPYIAPWGQVFSHCQEVLTRLTPGQMAYLPATYSMDKTVLSRRFAVRMQDSSLSHLTGELSDVCGESSLKGFNLLSLDIDEEQRPADVERIYSRPIAFDASQLSAFNFADECRIDCLRELAVADGSTSRWWSLEMHGLRYVMDEASLLARAIAPTNRLPGMLLSPFRKALAVFRHLDEANAVLTVDLDTLARDSTDYMSSNGMLAEEALCAAHWLSSPERLKQLGRLCNALATGSRLPISELSWSTTLEGPGLLHGDTVYMQGLGLKPADYRWPVNFSTLTLASTSRQIGYRLRAKGTKTLSCCPKEELTYEKLSGKAARAMSEQAMNRSTEYRGSLA